MSNSIFGFEPDLVENRDYSSTWSTIVTTFDSGTNQYQQEWSRNINDFRFVYQGYHEDLRWNLLEAFFNTHRGRGDSFLLPSWRAETKLITPYTGGVDLDVGNTIYFSAIAGKPGNLLHIKHPNGSPEEVKQISQVVSTTHIHLISAFNNSYPLDSVVQVAYRVRFGVDKMPPLQYMGYDIFTIELTFIEDV